MTRTQGHRVTIERHGRSHRAMCTCGWTSHAWNELRPAEADAWHHLFGDECIVDISAIPDHRPPTGPIGDWEGPAGPAVVAGSAGATATFHSVTVDALVRHAQDLAGRPSPYSRDAATDLWRASEQDANLLREATIEIEDLLARHEKQSSGAADSEWLQLITAKRLLYQALAHAAEAGDRWAMI